MNYEIRFRDIDSETGNVSQDKLIAVCETESFANLVLKSLRLSFQLVQQDSNREVYIKINHNEIDGK